MDSHNQSRRKRQQLLGGPVSLWDAGSADQMQWPDEAGRGSRLKGQGSARAGCHQWMGDVLHEG
jgi:hypothetical protein